MFTLVGSEDELVDALVAGVAVARERIDLRRTRARIRGSARPTSCRSSRSARDDMERAARRRARSARGSGRSACRSSSTRRPARGPAFYRRGGAGELQRRLDAGELAPDFGPAALDPAAGGVIVGARRPLIAFNVNLRGTLAVAREVAAVVRERGGGFPGVRALGLDLPRRGSSRCR